MTVDDLKKQIIMLRDSVLILCEQDRIEVMEFLTECFGDFRWKSFSYEEESVNEVLNLTKKEYFHLDNPYDFQDPYSHPRLPYTEPQNFSSIGNSSSYQYEGNFGTFDGPLDNWELETNEASNPVNLVLPQKEQNSVKKSRRKQMFTRKSVRRINEESSQNTVEVEKLKEIKCIACGKILKGNTNFIEHIKTHEAVLLSCKDCRTSFTALFQFFRHKDEKKCRPCLVCAECGAKFKGISQYMKHLNGHKENNCKHCSAKFSSVPHCKDHMKRCHPEVITDKDLIPCKFCPMRFLRHNRLYSHYQLHHAKGKFVCTSCGLFLPTKEKLKEHTLGHENEKKFSCNVCNKKFYFGNSLTNHLKMHNSGIYRCLTCNTTVASIAELKVHKRKKHEVLGLDPKFECEKCNKKFLKKSILKRHMFTHSNTREFPCNVCAKLFISKEGLVKHRKLKKHFDNANAVQTESKYEKLYEDQLICEHCGKQYKTYTQLVYHLRTHKGTYKCETCSKTFTLKINYTRHLKIHGKHRVESVCEQCGDAFARVEALKQHVANKHSDERPIKCSKCGKAFKMQSALNRHMRIHDNVRPYECFCGRNYKQIAHLRTHQKVAHGSNPIEGLTDDFAAPADDDDRRIVDAQVLTSLPPDSKGYVNSDGALLGFDNFEDPDYRLHDSFKVEYVGDDYGQQLGYSDLHFGAPPSVSPAVDLSMVAISDVVCRDMDTGLIKTEVKTDVLPHEPSSAIQLVNLSEHIVQEYLLNLP